MKKVNWLATGLSSLGVLAQSLPGEATAIPIAPETAGVHAPIATTPIATSTGSQPPAADHTASQSPQAGFPCPAPPESFVVEMAPCGDLADDPMAQVRSVNELSDVPPSDWAYEALQRLIERYGVLTGYRDGTFRGNRALTRYEFAATLNQVVSAIEERLSTTALAQIREDLIVVRRLQESYGQIATDLSDRLNRLDETVAELTRNQVSTTSKLTGQTVLALTNGTGAEATLISRVRLNLLTSFAPNSLLVTQLEAGNNGGDAVSREHNRQPNLLGTTGLLADGGGLDYVGVDRSLRLSKLYYTFQPLPSLNVTVGARLSPRDFIDYNRFAHESYDATANFSSSFFLNNPLIVQNAIDRPGGAGVVLTWKPETLPLTVRALYVAADAANPNASLVEGGLFGDRHQGSVELEYNFSKELTVRLQYTKATVNNVDISAGGINAEWGINRRFAVFGRYAFGRYEGFNPLLNRDLDLSPTSWAIGVILRQLIIPGSTVGMAIGQPFVEKDLGDSTQTNFELFYNFLLNDNVSFTPALLIVTNPNNEHANNTIWEWVVRMVYSF